METQRGQNEAQEMIIASASTPLSILNPHPRRVPGPALLHHLVRDISPHHLPAIDYRASDGTHKVLSYQDLQGQAEALSKRILASRPAIQGPGQLVVPVLLPQGPELYISQLAVLKAGGAFCPLHLDAPPERVRFILGDVSAKVVVTSAALRHEFEALELNVAVVTVDQDTLQNQRRQEEGSWTNPHVKPDSLAYVMYTSGSTGTPKGVGISHDAATQALLAHDPHIPSFSRFLQFAAPTFDVSVFEIFFPFFRGATLVSCSREALLNDLPGVLRTRHVDACELTPTVAGSLLRTRKNAPHLRLLLTIGEMLTEPVIKEFGGDEEKPSILWAMYGPTEATIHCTIQSSCNTSASSHDVGVPLDTVSAFILAPLEDDGSSDFRILPQGELGELAVGGHQTATGYINRPEQTTKVFVDTPFGRLYRTGDKALMKNDGSIECYGRISDGQVKLRGQRIELGEIEQAVLRTTGCHGAVASVIQGIIVVFYEQDDPKGTNTDDVLRTCRNWLPAFMVPGDIVAMQSFPRLPSGKVDRKKLKDDYQTSREQSDELFDGYQDDVERELAQVAEETLGIRLTSSSVLSAAGLDSLAAIKLAAHLRQAGYDIGAIDLLNSRTLSQLRSRAQKADKVSVADVGRGTTFVPSEIAQTTSTMGFNPGDIEMVVPCAPVQVSMIAETLKRPDAYCNWVELQVPATHSIDTVVSWFQEAARCNEVLRTGFIASQDGFDQIIWKPTLPVLAKAVHRFDRKYQLGDAGLARPFSVQVLMNRSRKHTNILMRIHHALYDGWSLDLLLSDLNMHARGDLFKERPPFRLVSTYYQSTQFHRDSATARSYWADYLLHYQPTPMPQMLAKNLTIGQTLSAQKILGTHPSIIRAAATRLDISTQAFFQACLLWLWGTVIGADDIVIGNVTSGRTVALEGVENVIGPCLTTIPLRARISQARTVKELLESIHMSNRESLAHCTLPLSDIKKVAGYSPSQPLYEALFVFQESIPSREGQQAPVTVRQVAHEDYLETKLLVEIEPMAEGFQLRTTYHADCFHHGYMQLFLRQFECILAHAVNNLEADISSISACFSENLTSVHNRHPKTLGGVADLAMLFEKTAEERRDKPAICFLQPNSDQQLTMTAMSYGELNKLANQIARHLCALGASTNHTVAIIMEKSTNLYAAILGVLKCGCAYLPLLPSTPSKRVKMILKQAGPRLCIYDDTSNPQAWDVDGCNFVNLEQSHLFNYEDSNVGTPVDPSRIANIIYTSGSTGVPKGVCVSQLNICSNLDVLSRIYPVKEDSRMLQACSQAFDVSVFEILFALTRGMCLCSATNDTLFANLEKSIRALEVTHISMTPTVASLIEPKNVPKVEFLVTSGEPMTSEVARKWVGKLYQGYGPSETTNICSVKKMTSEDHIRHLGFTFENTSVVVLSPQSLDAMPIGSVGELCFGGDQVVAGYLNLPEITSEKFIQHPKFGRLYRSGDIGRMLADGSLLIVGRIDDQVKLRGQRIELGEINATVASISTVTNCVTLLVQTGSSLQLACYYVPVSSDSNKLQVLEASRESAERNRMLFDSLRSRLPNYMIPSYLIPISTVPMTSSGKVDKVKLKQLFEDLGPGDLQIFGADAEPRKDGGQWSKEEETIAAVVAETLRMSLPDVGRWTPLTSLGLDSISAISVARALQRRLCRKVLISQILRSNSVARLGALMAKQEEKVVLEGTYRNLLPPEVLEIVEQQLHARGLEFEKLLPCTPLQEAMLASSSGSSTYLNRILLRLNSDVSKMKNHWATMFQRHGILRTCFFSTNSREQAIIQAVLRQWEPEWLSFNTRTSSLDDAIKRHAATVSAAIDSGIPSVSLATIQDDNVSYLSIICHHAYYDGVAISRLLEEVEHLASGMELPEAPSYESFLREMSRPSESTDAFWKRHLSGFHPIVLPRSPGVTIGRGLLAQHLAFPYSNIRDRLKVLNCTLLSLTQACWANLLHIVLQSDDVCFGNVVSGRTQDIERLDELVAPCFNTIPLRMNFQEKKHNMGVVKTFQSLNIEALQYQFTPLRRIQSICSSEGVRLFDTLLLLQQAPRALEERLWTLERDEGDMDVPLVCEVTPLPDSNELEIKIHFDRSFVSDAFASFVYDTLAHLIDMFLQYPSSEVACKESIPTSLQARLDDIDLDYPIESPEEKSAHTAMNESWTQTEAVIRSVLSTISTVQEDKVTRNTTIFQLGLDSINAVQVAAMLREHGFPNVTATDVLESRSSANLASKLDNTQSKTEELAKFDISGFQERARHSLHSSVSDWEPVETILPCSPLQMGMLKEFLDSKGRDYLNFMSLQFDYEFNGDALFVKAAWCQLVEAHEILRSGFTPLDLDDASFAMLQYKFQKNAVPVSDRTGDNTFSLAAWKQEVAAEVLNNIKLPPWRIAIVNSMDGIQMHLAIHHAIYDAQSLHILFEDFNSALCGRSLECRPNISAVVQDVITQIHSSKEEDKVFWERQAPLAVINKFPIMTPLKEVERDLLVEIKACSLPLTALEEHVKNAGVTVQAVAQTAWLRILASYLGEASVVFGTILSGRNSEAMHDAVFPCIATLPVIAQDSPSNRQALQAMMDYNIGLQRHQRAPLADIQRWVGHPSTKLFDTLLVYQKFEFGQNEARPWRVHDEQAAVDYPVSIEIEHIEGSVYFRITSYSDVLPVEQAKLLLQQFDAVFCALAKYPDGNDEGLREVRQDLFSVVPAQEPELKSDVRFLHDFVDISAQRSPDKIALEFVSCFRDNLPISRQWSYRELRDNGNKVANMLAGYVTAGDIVAIYFEKCPEAHFAMLGILKAGCAFLALDPGAPSSRKEFIMKDSGAVVLLTDEPRSLNLDIDIALPVLTVSEDSLQALSATPPKLSRTLEPVDRSYCLYTSGTTGTPKGCEITHENVVQAMLAFQKLFEGHWDENSRWLQFASYHFDVSVLEQYWTWAVGITLFAAPRDVILEDLVGTISILQITHIDLTPSLARLVHPDDVPSLCRGVFITGGEELKQQILDVWGPKRVIHNFYGPTEATIGVTTYPCVPINGKSSNIGRQFANVGSYVLRPGTEIPVLRGGVGELCVSGKLVGKGYLNRDDLTAERFPMLKAYNERVYRTGDLVRVLHDGCFDFLGRADDQVKLRGQRLEIGEINHCIRSGVPEVNDIVTVVVRNEKQQKDLLVTFVVTTQGQLTGELRVITGQGAQAISSKAQRACREKLPGYMIPTYVLLLPFIPLSPNNKAELKVLRTLFNTLSSEQLIAPSMTSVTDLGGIGKTIRRTLSRMASVAEDDISPASSIFELGVDSISVMRLARMLKQEGVRNATPATILRNPVLADLAHALGVTERTPHPQNGTLEAKQAVEACQHRHRSFVCRTLGVKAAEIEYVAPCSALQQGMISRSRTKEDSEAYFNTFHFELADGLSISKLRLAWESLMRKHSILRTRFVSTTEGFIQAALKETMIPWSEVSLEQDQELGVVLDQRLGAWIGKNEQHIEQPWELHAVHDNNKRWLVVHVFHGIYDATSFDLMIGEVARLYRDETPVDEGPGFLDALLHGPLRNFSPSKGFWINHLKGTKSTPIPHLSDHPSESHLSVSRKIEFEDLEQVRKALGVTQQAIIQALWSLVLLRYLRTGTTLGIIVSGRAMELENVDKTIGPLFNTIPYHYRASKSQTWSSVVRQCHEFNTAVLPFQHVPLRDIQKWCSGGRPVFDTLFSFQRRSATAQSTEGLWREPESSLNPDYPLAFEATLDSESAMQVVLVTQKGVADEHILAELLDNFEAKARAVAANPNGLCHAPGDVDATEEEQPANLMNETNENPPEKSESKFEWTSQSQAIRQQMALLSEVEESSITELTTLLELGLDSIDTVKLSARLKRAGISLSNSDLIRSQSIEKLSALLTDRQTEKGAGVTDSGYSSDVEDPPAFLEKYLGEIGSELGDVEQILPPTPLQDSMVSEMINSDFHLYFNHDVLELSEDTNVDRLKEAWSTVFRNTPILRTAFIEVESQEVDFAYAQLVPKQRISPIGEVQVQSSDEIASVKAKARERAVQGRGHSDLFQVTFVKSPERTYVALSIAHALYDGWSLSLLHRDVEAAYYGTYSPRPTYTEYLHKILRSSRKGAQDFWSDYILDARRTILPPQGEHNTEVNRAEISMNISPSTLIESCKRHAISHQALAQACWAAVLATYSRHLDVTFGVVLSGRETEASEAMLFPTMNTVPVRAVFHGSVSNFLRYMQDNITNINHFQHYPLRKIQALAQNKQGSLFNTLFILQKGTETIHLGKPLMKSMEGTSAVEYPVCVEMEVSGEKVLWRTACDCRYLSSDGVAKLLTDIEAVLGFLVHSSDEDILRFSDDGVSICGLAPFQPEGLHIPDESELQQMGENDGVWSPIEETIRSVIAKMSGVETSSISKRHNLYHLGLDSIRAIKVSSALRKCGVTVTVRDLIQAASIQDMATKASEKAPVLTAPNTNTSVDVLTKTLSAIPVNELLASTGIDSTDVAEVLPATAMQTHMLSVWHNTKGAVFYTDFRYRLAGVNDRGVVERIWEKLVELNSVLRTIFMATNSNRVPFLQVVLPPKSPIKNPFLSVDVRQHDDKTFLLRLKIHHALYDGVSLPLIMSRFKALLSQEPISVVDDSSQSLAWKSWIASRFDSSASAQRQSFWTEYLRGCSASSSSPSPAPSAYHDHMKPTPTTATASSEDGNSRLSVLRRAAISDTAKLKSLCTQRGVSLQAVFLAAYAQVLASTRSEDLTKKKTEEQGNKNKNNNRDIIFGVYLANRGTGSEEELPYPTLCLVPLRVELQVGPAAAADSHSQLFDVAARVQKDLHRISAAENISVGLWEIKEWTGGVVVDSFVNFLSLPGDNDEALLMGENGPVGGGLVDVRLEAFRASEDSTATTTTTTSSTSTSSTPTDNDPDSNHTVEDSKVLAWIQKNVVKDAYPDAIDVEASLQADGAMDIGVFGSRARLENGRDLIHMIVDILELS